MSPDELSLTVANFFLSLEDDALIYIKYCMYCLVAGKYEEASEYKKATSRLAKLYNDLFFLEDEEIIKIIKKEYG